MVLIGLVFLKYLEIQLTSFYDLAGMEGGIFLMLAGIDMSNALLLRVGVGIILGVSLAAVFSLRDLLFLSVIRESHLD